ncbi:MAG TPA: hypothetical protein PLH92_07810 [Mycobacterium sp.]|nr:hypothetical protein [Mycobacterium sp.]HQC76610.1 hypothetical protein [Mycobacterium sp.]
MSADEIEARKKKAERGWLTDPPPPQPDRRYVPGEEHKWYLMTGAHRLLEQKLERERRATQDIADRYRYLKEQDRLRGDAR